jgi:hypothetical protein
MSRGKKIGIAVLIALVITVGIILVLHKRPKPAPIVEVPEQVLSTHEVIGNSVQGRSIDAYTYGNGNTHLVFVGGMHGGYEWNSVLLVYEFKDYLDKNLDSIPKNLKITVIPSLNPDGVFKVVGKEGRFSAADASTNKTILASGRFNAHNVDLNRNFDCNWQPKSTWQSKTLSAGRAAFSEPEAQAIKNFAEKYKPTAFVFWHSQANAVYSSECNNGILPQTLDITNAYSKAAGYPAIKSFDSYKVTGDSEGWLASQHIPASTVELKTHETIEWDKNLAGIKALLEYYGTPSL